MLLCKDDDSVELGSLEGEVEERGRCRERGRGRERESTALCVSSKAICVLSIDTRLPALSPSLHLSLFPSAIPPLFRIHNLKALALSLAAFGTCMINTPALAARCTLLAAPCQPRPCTGCGRD